MTGSPITKTHVKAMGKYGGGKKWRKIARESIDVMKAVDFDVVEQAEGNKRSREGGCFSVELGGEVDGKKARLDDEDSGWREAWSASLQTRRAL